MASLSAGGGTSENQRAPEPQSLVPTLSGRATLLGFPEVLLEKSKVRQCAAESWEGGLTMAFPWGEPRGS